MNQACEFRRFMMRHRLAVAMLAAAIVLTALPQAASAQASRPAVTATPSLSLPSLTGSQAGASLVNWALLITVLSIAPAVLVLVTCFTRIVVVLSLLRAALAVQQVPPNQVLLGLALLMSIAVMAPTARAIHADAVGPYLDGRLPAEAALKAGEAHARQFMIRQIEAAGNSQDVFLFLPQGRADAVKTWQDVDSWSLIPAYVVSELKVAFAMGFRIFLPFVIVDLLVASVLASVGMLMMPPSAVSLPLKLLLFVLADGWRLVVQTLMGSF